ncbi:MAG: DJ-1/PfpI family protein [Candidatus Micrarchaeia archaeon]
MKVLMVVAPVNFQDREYEDTRKELENAGIGIETASTRAGTCTGRFGGKVEAKALGEMKADDFDAIIFIGGPGTPLVRADEKAVKLAQEFSGKGKLVCAICWASTILAKAGILVNKRATLWVGFDGEYGKSTDEMLSDEGAIVERKPVVIDGKIITADGPAHASVFGREIAKALKTQG